MQEIDDKPQGIVVPRALHSKSWRLFLSQTSQNRFKLDFYSPFGGPEGFENDREP